MASDMEHLVDLAGEDARHLAQRARRFVEGVPPVFKAEQIASLRWSCVAVEDEIRGVGAARLAQACAAFGYHSSFAVEIPWEPSDREPLAYKSDLSALTIEQISKELLIGSCFFLLEERESFAVASDGDLYWMLAGPRDFLELALGSSLEEQTARFAKVVEAYRDVPALATVQQVCAGASSRL